MFEWLHRYFTKRKYRITITESVADVSITYIIEADTMNDLIKCVTFAKEQILMMEDK